MSGAEVSIVIPTRDRADLVVQAAASCLRDSGAAVEVIVVDDGGHDDTEAALAALQPRPRYLRQDWAGRSAARNRGVAAARAPVVAFLDSDDLSLPGRFGRELARLERGVAGVWGQIELIDGGGDPLREMTRRYQRELSALARRGATPRRLATRMRIYPSTLLLRRDTFEQLGGFDESLFAMEDVDFALRLATLGPLAFEPGPVAAIRVHTGNTASDPMFRALLELTAKLIRSHADDRPFHAGLLAEQARAHWALGETGAARSTGLAALRTDPTVAADPAFVKRLLGSLLPGAAVNPLRRAIGKGHIRRDG